MIRQEFLKIASERYSLYFKPRVEDVESVICEKCGENDTNINAVIDFAEWIDNAVLKRPEINSDDVLQFVVAPCIDSAEFWSDIKKTVFYNGYIAGLAGVIKTIYVSSDGKFYDHKHELIAANEEDFLDYLLSVEFDFHPVIKECVYDTLREAGWYEGRCVDVTELNDRFKAVNVFLSQAQLDFLKEFSGITLKADNGYKCRFLSAEKILSNISGYYTNNKYRQDNCPLAVIVSDAADFSYYIQTNGIISIRGIPKGRTTMECINHVIKNLFLWTFDIDEPRK
ncbi:MAG: hypothetical protein HDT43_04190 [Ruminococcaceae bacterium]|nr:hypothetical protein [Oscillospiraceae bacterium]